MKKELRYLLLLMAVALMAIHSAGCDWRVANTNESNGTNSRLSGGACQYRDYAGTVTIKEIHPPLEAGGSEILTVEFDADRSIAPPRPLQHFGNDVSLSREQMDKKGIAVGKKFSAHASYIEHGTCNPGPYLADVDEWR